MNTALTLAYSIIIRALNNPGVRAAATQVATEAGKSILNSVRTIVRRNLRLRGFRI